MAVKIKITSAGNSISNTLDIYYTTDNISWIYLVNVTLTDLLAGYVDVLRMQIVQVVFQEELPLHLLQVENKINQ